MIIPCRWPREKEIIFIMIPATGVRLKKKTQQNKLEEKSRA